MLVTPWQVAELGLEFRLCLCVALGAGVRPVLSVPRHLLTGQPLPFPDVSHAHSSGSGVKPGSLQIHSRGRQEGSEAPWGQWCGRVPMSLQPRGPQTTCTHACSPLTLPSAGVPHLYLLSPRA